MARNQHTRIKKLEEKKTQRQAPVKFGTLADYYRDVKDPNSPLYKELNAFYQQEVQDEFEAKSKEA